MYKLLAIIFVIKLYARNSVFKILFAYFLRDIHEGHLSLKHTDNGQSNFVAKIKSSDKGNKQLKNCLINSGLLFIARENVFNNFKRRLSPIKKVR